MKNNKDLEWEVVSEKHILRDEYMDLRAVRFRMPDGSEAEPFYRYSRRSYVVVVARDEEGKFICVRQYRFGIGKVTVEFPAGGIESNGSEYGAPKEGTLDAARRELQEETGYVSEDWTHLITVPSNATIADNYAHVYFADNCRRVSGLHLDETEFLEPEIYTAEEIEEMIQDGTFAQAVHIMAWEMVKNRKQI